MRTENKELLLKDLCARLPYGVICNDNRHGSSRVTNIDITPDDIEHKNPKVVLYYFDFDECGELKNCKPYLRPMSSMTEEERKEYNEYLFHGASIGLMSNTETAYELIDWLNAYHFDYRGLIERGLAIAVTENNNSYED